MVMEVVHEDMGEGSMQCTNHPYKNSSPGGICAFCLQEKLGKLVSSSYPAAVFPSTSSSPSPSFRSTFNVSAVAGGHLAASSASTAQNGGSDCSSYHGYYTRKSRLPFVLTHRKKKKKDEGAAAAVRSADSAAIVFKRSKSTATPRRGNIHFLNESCSEDYIPNRRRFWSFLYSSKQSTARRSGKNLINITSSVNGNGGEIRSREEEREDFENVGPIDRRVSRSRSVGCGSRSFSGDFFERISTGFGDCTLRRVESQREGKLKMHKNGEDCIKERVKSCGGIFSGFMITSSSSSSHLITSSVEENNVNRKSLGHGRSRSWGWAFASPMRAFGKNSAVKRDASSSSSNKNAAAPNLAAIPSLLAVSG